MVQGRMGKIHERGMLSRCYSKVMRFATGSALGLAAFSFVSKMMRRDWLFRRALLTQTWIPLLFIAGIILSLAHSGMQSTSAGFDPSNAYILPHFLGLVTMALCINLPFTDFHRGAWIYLSAPIGSMRTFARGVFWALWIPAAGLPHGALLVFLMRMVNWKEAAFIAGFNLLVVSLYLAFEIRMISGLPFSNPMNESRAMANVIYIQVCWLMGTAVPIALQQVVCEHLSIALPAMVVLLAGIWLVLHVNLGNLEQEIRWRLHLLKVGPNPMFREFE